MINYPPSIYAVVDGDAAAGGKNVEQDDKVFNIKVTKFFEADQSSIDWNINRTLQELQENHHYLTKNLGLLRNFHFVTTKPVKRFSFSSHEKTRATINITAQINEYLHELSLLNPIPTVVISFLALEHVTYAEKMRLTEKMRLQHESHQHIDLIDVNNNDTPNSNSVDHSPLSRGSLHMNDANRGLYSKRHHLTKKKRNSHSSNHSLRALLYCADSGKIVNFILIAYALAVLHVTVVGFLRVVTGFRSILNLGLWWSQLGLQVDSWLLYVRHSLEMLILAFLLSTCLHKILARAVSRYFQRKLCTHIDGRYNFNFEAISIRLAVDKNQLVFSGFEWRNPPGFTDTPYFIHIDEIRFTFDLFSVYEALVRHNKAVRVTEIKIKNCNIYIEKRVDCRNKENGLLNMYAAVGKHDLKDVMGSSSSKRNSGIDPNRVMDTEQQQRAVSSEKLKRSPSWFGHNLSTADLARDGAATHHTSSNSSLYNSTLINRSVSVDCDINADGGSVSAKLRRSASKNSFFDTSGASGKYSHNSTGATGTDGAANEKTTRSSYFSLRPSANTITADPVPSSQFSGLKKQTSMMRKSASHHHLGSLSSALASQGGGSSSGSKDDTLLNSSKKDSSRQQNNISAAATGTIQRSERNERNNKDNSNSGMHHSTSCYSLNSADSFSEMHDSHRGANHNTKGTADLEQEEGESNDYIHFDIEQETQCAEDQYSDSNSERIAPSASIQSGVKDSNSKGKENKPKKTTYSTSAAPTTTTAYINNTKNTTNTDSSVPAVEESPYDKNKRIFGFPFKLDISVLVISSLEMHIQDLLNASHVDHAQSSTITLTNMVMTHEDLTKAPIFASHARKGIFLDEVMWRTVNHVMNELLRTNKVTLLSIFASAAANQTAAAVRNLAKWLFKGGHH